MGEKEKYPFQNTPLPYAYDALEPYIDEKTMRVHHELYLQAYTDRLNDVLKNCKPLQNMDLEQLIFSANRLPKAVGIPILRNAGGIFNHRFYFLGMCPSPQEEPSGDLKKAICKRFGSYGEFQKAFRVAAIAVYGSGYVWLGCGPNRSLEIFTTANQQTPFLQHFCPILNVDMWEHAYFLKHIQMRGEYVDDWFHVVDWEEAESRYLCIQKGGLYR